MTDNQREWIEWAGGPCPVHDSAEVEIITLGCPSGLIDTAEYLEWEHLSDGEWTCPLDIIAYRVIDVPHTEGSAETDPRTGRNRPLVAISVRQPWAWAIIHAGKNIENRDTVQWLGSTPKRVSVHASQGMTRAEYEAAADFMETIGITCPHPADLIRGAIIGTVTITAVATPGSREAESPWFFGPHGLVLADPAPSRVPIPAKGALGLFSWPDRTRDSSAPIKPWMHRYGGTK